MKEKIDKKKKIKLRAVWIINPKTRVKPLQKPQNKFACENCGCMDPQICINCEMG